MISFKSNENIHKKEGESYYIVSANKASSVTLVFRRTWTDAKELLKEKSFFILSFVFLSEFVIRQVQTNIY